MNTILKTLVLTLLILLVNWWHPFWVSVMVIPFLFAALFIRNLIFGTLIGFLSGLFAWGSICSYQYFTGSSFIANRMAEVFHLFGGGIVVLVGIALIGGCLAGLGGLTGSSLRAIFISKKRYSSNY